MHGDDIIALKECNAGCETDNKPEMNKIYEYCIDSPHLQESVYPFCDTVSDGDMAKMKCSTRMCQTCCAMANAEFKIDITNEDVFECLSECEDRYLVTPMTNKDKKE